METGFRGTFVIPLHQVLVDGRQVSDPAQLRPGAILRWRGSAIRVDRAGGVVLSLSDGAGASVLHKRAAMRLRRFSGLDLNFPDATPSVPDSTNASLGPVLRITDGQSTYVMELIDRTDTAIPILMVHDNLPPVETDLRIAHNGSGCTMKGKQPDRGVICFTPGTRLDTPDGPIAVENLREGDRISTRDDGAQEIRWIGQRRMTGARFHAMPDLCPIRIRAGAMGVDVPPDDLIISPDHRVLIRGAHAQALFNSDEVLVAARDLVNDYSITVLHGVPMIDYIHLALDRHQIVWANGVETETFHPASCAADAILEEQREHLFSTFPKIATNPMAYGEYARRPLTRPEAAILRAQL